MIKEFKIGDISIIDIYDEQNRLIHSKSSDGHEFAVFYDEQGEVKMVKHANGFEAHSVHIIRKYKETD